MRLQSVPRRARAAWRDRGKPTLHLLRPGKTGGTALGHVMRTTPAANYRFQLHMHQDTLADIPVGEQVCFAIREPASRFVSGFNSRLRQGGTVHHRPWDAAEAEAFGHFPSPEELALGLYADDPEVAARAARAMDAVSHLRRHQVRWVGDLATLNARAGDMFVIFRQWSLDEDFGRFVDLVGLPAGTSLPQGEIAHRTPGEMKKGLSEQAKQNVLRWYADDVEFLAELERLGTAVGYGGIRS